MLKHIVFHNKKKKSNQLHKNSKIIKLCSMILVCCLLVQTSNVSVLYAEDEINKLYALSAVLMDADTGRVLFGKDEHKQLAMASTTKIMTCIIALEQGNVDDIVTVSKYAASMPDVQLDIAKGEQYRLGDLLYSLMLESHNDVAVAIAEHIGGTVEGFATMMNEKAKDLGAFDTHFVTPNGLDAQGHYTTAENLGKIAAYAMKNETFMEIINTKSYQFEEVNGKRSCSVNNKNAFLTMMDGAVGMKTGFTSDAGYCFVGALKSDGRNFVSVVLGSGWPPHKTYKWADTKQLMKYGIENYTKKDIFKLRQDFPSVAVIDGKQEQVDIYMDEGTLPYLVKENESANVKYQWKKTLKAPVSKGEVIGSATYYIGDEQIGSFPIRAENSVEKVDFKWFLDKVAKVFFM